MYRKFSQPYLLHNIKGTWHKWPVYSSSTSFSLGFMYTYLINQDLLDLKEFEGEGQSQIFQKPTLELKQFP